MSPREDTPAPGYTVKHDNVMGWHYRGPFNGRTNGGRCPKETAADTWTEHIYCCSKEGVDAHARAVSQAFRALKSDVAREYLARQLNLRGKS